MSSRAGFSGKSEWWAWSQAVGGTVAPIIFRAILDIGAPQWLFFGSAIFLVICMLSVLGSAHQSKKVALSRNCSEI